MVDLTKWQTHRMCRRKLRFRSRAEAYGSYIAIVRSLRAYACPVCDYWHLTSRPMDEATQLAFLLDQETAQPNPQEEA